MSVPHPTPPTITQTKNGKRLAFTRMVNKYQQSIINFCGRMLGNRNEAEDAAQEIFIRAYTKRDTQRSVKF